MKILFFLINLNLGGTEKSFLNLLSKLDENYQVYVLLLEKKGELLKRLPSNVKVIEIEHKDIINEFIRIGSRKFGFQQLRKMNLSLFIRCQIQFLLNKLNLSINPYWAISKYIKPQIKQYDVSVAYAGIHNFIAHYVLTKTTAKKKILWVHFDVNSVISDFRFGRNFYNQFDKVFCVSENSSTVFMERFPKAAPKVFTLNNIVNVTELKQLSKKGEYFSLQEENNVILTLGRLSREKGQQMIPEVAKKLKADGFEFTWYLIGDGNIRNEIEILINQFNLNKELKLLGKKENPYGYLNACDIYVQTSLHEGYCITLREAQIFKKPIVTTNFLSACNLIKDGVDGLIVDISVDGLYEGVKKLIQDKTLRDKLSNATSIKETTNTIVL